jgi:hypothetical protein
LPYPSGTPQIVCVGRSEGSPVKYLTLVMLVCCDHSHAQPFDFPLHAGDMWRYRGGYAFDVNIVAETTMQNGRTYAVLDYVGYPGSWPHDFHFLRDTAGNVFHYNPSTDTEEPLYQFDQNPGDTIFSVSVGFGTFADTVDIMYDGPVAWPVLGNQQSCEMFSFQYRHLVDVGWEARYANDGMGIVSFETATGSGNVVTSNLVGARVNGVEYGDLTDAPIFEQPVAFVLHQNYPNPFNPGTQIEYTVGGVKGQGSGVRGRTSGQSSVVSIVRLTVYDLLGRKVAVLVDEPQAPGDYTVR